MRRMRLFLSAVGVLMAMSIAGYAQDVHTDYDKKADFGHFHTYQWDRVKTTNGLWEQRVKDAVDKDLQEKGWQKVDSGADIMVDAVGASQDQQEYREFYNGFGPGWGWWGWRGGPRTVEVVNYKTGTLVVDMYDANTKQLVWRGTAADSLSQKPEKNEKKLDKAVDKMFDKFPPKAKD